MKPSDDLEFLSFNQIPYSQVTNLDGSQILGLLFDASDLLYHRPSKTEHISSSLAQIFGKSALISSFSSIERESLKSLAYTGKISKIQYQDSLLQLLFPDFEFTDENLPKAREVLDYESRQVVFFDGVKETLLKLKQKGFKMALIANTVHSSKHKEEIFLAHGLQTVFDVIISSCDARVMKPHPEIYILAMSRLNLDSSQVLFVGHKQNELEGAQNVGIVTVAYNHSNSVKSDFSLKHFSELLTLPTPPNNCLINN